MGGDIEAIIPSVDYPLEYDECIDVAKEETDSGARTEITEWIKGLDLN